MRHIIKKRTSPEASVDGGKLNLVLSGFSGQDVVSVEDMVRAIDLLPGFHLEGLREIVYLPEYAPIASRLACPGYSRSEPKGEFVQRERRIFIYHIDSPAVFFQMLYHEIGHFVFFLIIASRVKKRWVTEMFPGSRCVTRYASVNPWEDFAETYAYYVLHPDVSQRDAPQKYAFMRDYVFSGNPGNLKQCDREEPAQRS